MSPLSHQEFDPRSVPVLDFERRVRRHESFIVRAASPMPSTSQTASIRRNTVLKLALMRCRLRGSPSPQPACGASSSPRQALPPHTHPRPRWQPDHQRMEQGRHRARAPEGDLLALLHATFLRRASNCCTSIRQGRRAHPVLRSREYPERAARSTALPTAPNAGRVPDRKRAQMSICRA